MRLPHVTIEYREEETFAIGDISLPLIVGFGVHWAWVYLVMFNGCALFFQGGAGAQRLCFGLSLAVFSLVFLAYAAFLERARSLFETPRMIRRNRAVAAASVATGTALLFLGGLPGAAGTVALVVSAMLTGFGSVVLLMSFGVSFSVCDVATCAATFALSLIPTALAFVGVVALNDAAFPLGALACIALPFIELGCLYRCSAQLVDKLEFTAITVPVRSPAFPIRLGLPCLVFGLIIGATRSIAASSTSQELVPMGAGWAVMLAAACACIAILAAMLLQRQTVNFMFRMLLPVVALIMAVASAQAAESGRTSTTIVFCAYLLLEGCMWVALADISQRFRISAFTVFGIGRGMMGVGALACFLLGLPESPLHHVFDNIVSLTIVAYVLVTLGYSLLPKTGEIRRCLVRTRCPALLAYEAYARAEELDGDGDDDRVDVLPAMPQACGDGEPRAETVQGGRPDGTGEAATAATGTAEKPRKHGIPDGVVDGTAARSAGGSYHEAVGAAPVPDASDHRAGTAYVSPLSTKGPARTQTVPVASDTGAPVGTEQDGGRARQGRFKRKCAAVADTFLLSRKETEVLFLLAKGHNAAAIQEALYISPGTANTHMRHIYRKLNVHSQQDLIRLVDSMDVD